MSQQDEVAVVHKIERPVGLLRTLRAVVGAWFSGRPVVIMTGPLEIRCPCGACVFTIERSA